MSQYIQRICNLLLGCLYWGVWNGAVTVSRQKQLKRHYTRVTVVLTGLSAFWCCFLSKHREQRKNVHTHVSIVQREGPGYALFSTDGSRGGGERGCVHVCRGGSGVCFFSVCQQANSPLIWAAKMTGHTPVFARSLSPYPINLSTHLSPRFLSLYLTSLPDICIVFGYWICCNMVHSFDPTLLCIHLYMVQGWWHDNFYSM